MPGTIDRDSPVVMVPVCTRDPSVKDEVARPRVECSEARQAAIGRLDPMQGSLDVRHCVIRIIISTMRVIPTIEHNGQEFTAMRQ